MWDYHHPTYINVDCGVEGLFLTFWLGDSLLYFAVFGDRSWIRKPLQRSDCTPRCCNVWRSLCTCNFWPLRAKGTYLFLFPANHVPYGMKGKWLADVSDYFSLIWQSKVIDNVNFRNFLELVPVVRELINDFYSRFVEFLYIVISSSTNIVIIFYL